MSLAHDSGTGGQIPSLGDVDFYAFVLGLSNVTDGSKRSRKRKEEREAEYGKVAVPVKRSILSTLEQLTHTNSNPHHIASHHISPPLV